MTPLDRAASLAKAKGIGAAGFARGYFDRLADILAGIDAVAVGELVGLLERARERNALIAFCGNGGKAAICAEWANDLGIEAGSNFRAISLCENAAVLTSIANDEGYQFIFARQVEVLLRPGDVLVALSASGASANVRKAAKAARNLGATTVALTGTAGSPLGGAADLEVCANTGPDECGLSEDAHMAIMHAVVNWLMRAGT